MLTFVCVMLYTSTVGGHENARSFEPFSARSPILLYSNSLTTKEHEDLLCIKYELFCISEVKHKTCVGELQYIFFEVLNRKNKYFRFLER
jgi:hypothetical protein